MNARLFRIIEWLHNNGALPHRRSTNEAEAQLAWVLHKLRMRENQNINSKHRSYPCEKQLSDADRQCLCQSQSGMLVVSIKAQQHKHGQLLHICHELHQLEFEVDWREDDNQWAHTIPSARMTFDTAQTYHQKTILPSCSLWYGCVDLAEPATWTRRE